MSSKKVPLFTTGAPGQPSVKVNNPDPNTIYYNSYTGEQLPGRPSFNTPTGNTTGNTTFHGGSLYDR